MTASSPSSPEIRFLRSALERRLISEEDLFGAHSKEAATWSEQAWVERFHALETGGRFLGDEWDKLRQDIHFPRHSSHAEVRDDFPEVLRERFEPLDRLGEGGMGYVFKAMDHRLHRVVALKFLRHLEPDTQERFLKEAQAQARMEHPCIGQVYEVVPDAERPYLVLQYIDGPTLSQMRGALGLEETVNIFRQLAEALHECHRSGVLHRDIKPSNILLEAKPEGGWHPYLVDFGLARHLEAPSQLTQPGIILGTPAYASPESLRGAEVDRRSDVYGLGATLYDAITGRPPFDAASTWALLQDVQTRDPIPPSQFRQGLPRDLETIMLKSLEKLPSGRYDSARAMGEDLQRFLDGDPIIAHAAGRLYRWQKQFNKLGPIRYALLGLALAALAAAGFGVWTLQRSRTQSALAQRFGGEVDRLESEWVRELSLPRHNVRPELDRLESRIAELSRQLNDHGQWVQAPARRALGRGFLALGKLDQARTELEAAWALSTPKDPEIAAVLGVTLARLFQDELEGLRGKAREDKRKELDQRLRGPALSFLRAAEGAPGVSHQFIEAVLANVEEQDAVALARLEEVKTQQPWNPEPWLLEAEIRRVQGGTALAQGAFEQALSDTDRALKAVEKAGEIWRSSPRVHEAEAQCCYQILWILADQGKARESDRRMALESADRAIEVDPGNWRAWSVRSAIHRRWATVQRERGGDPGESLIHAQSDSEKGLALHGGDNALWNNYVTLLRTRAEWEQSQGRDPRPSLTKARQALDQAMVRPQLRDFLLNNKGNCLTIQATWMIDHGEDPSATIEEASASFEEAMALRPWVGHAASQGLALREAARFQRWTGGNPIPFLLRARNALDRSLALNPNSYLSHQWIAEILVLLDRWEPAGSKASLASAERHAKRAIELNPRSAEAWFALAETLWHQGGKASALEAFRKAQRLDPHLLPSTLGLHVVLTPTSELPRLHQELTRMRHQLPSDANLALWEGRLLQRQGQQKEAERAYAMAVQLNPNLAMESRRPLPEW